MKKIILQRMFEINESTIGRMITNDGLHLCYTIERLWLNNRVNESCIPPGFYNLIYTASGTPSFAYPLYKVEEVEGRSNILIHRGNNWNDTQGCILPNSMIEGDHGYNSSEALEVLIDYLNREEAVIEIRGS